MILSIIIPCYNKKNEIQRTLDSVFGQLTDQCELIVLDDASTDGTDKILADWFRQGEPKNQVRVAHGQKNRGVAQIRNLGMRLSQGEYIHFLDGDDCLLPGYISNLLAILIEVKPDLISSQGRWRHSGKIRPKTGCYHGILRQTAHPQLHVVRSPYAMMGRYLALGGSQVAFRKKSCGKARANQGENQFEDFGFYFSWIKEDSQWLYWERVGILYEDRPGESLSRKPMILSQVSLPSAITAAPTKKIQMALAGVWIFSLSGRMNPVSALQTLHRYWKIIWPGFATKYGLAGILRLIKKFLLH